jgi:hypothetical protein
MSDMDYSVPAGFGADGEALAAQGQHPTASPWPVAGPALFIALVAVLAVLRGLGVLPS